MPHFFAHVARQKGYYNPEKKHYTKYHTSMDYVQTIVNGFKIRNSYKKNWLPLSVVLDNKLFRTNRVNSEQISKIYNLLRVYINDRKLLFASDISKEDRNMRLEKLYSDIVDTIDNELIGFSTMYRLLQSIEDKENSQIKNILLPLLFQCGNESFKKAIIDSCSEVKQLEDGGNDVILYGIGYKITEKAVKWEGNL